MRMCKAHLRKLPETAHWRFFSDTAETLSLFLTFSTLVSDFQGTSRLCLPELNPWKNSILLQQLLEKNVPC